MLEFVNNVQQSILSDDVLSHFNEERSEEGLYYGQTRHSVRDSSNMSNRSLLANALETTAQNDIERNKLNQYKAKIELIDAEEQRLHEINAELNDLFFSRGKRDAERVKELKFEKKQVENRINTYDRQLLTLEASKPLKDVLEREKI